MSYTFSCMEGTTGRKCLVVIYTKLNYVFYFFIIFTLLYYGLGHMHFGGCVWGKKSQSYQCWFAWGKGVSQKQEKPSIVEIKKINEIKVLTREDAKDNLGLADKYRDINNVRVLYHE